MARHDLTNERWFFNRRNFYRGNNLLFELIDNFDYMQAFGDNSLNNTHFLGKLHLDLPSGYYLSWDGRHVCDRCGTIVEPDGYAKTTNLAYGKTINARLAEMTICYKCDQELLRENPHPIHPRFPYPLSWVKQPMPNDWHRYAWL